MIIITGQNSGDAEATAMKLGADAFIGKPFDPMNLLKLAGEFVNVEAWPRNSRIIARKRRSRSALF